MLLDSRCALCRHAFRHTAPLISGIRGLAVSLFSGRAADATCLKYIALHQIDSDYDAMRMHVCRGWDVSGSAAKSKAGGDCVATVSI